MTKAGVIHTTQVAPVKQPEETRSGDFCTLDEALAGRPERIHELTFNMGESSLAPFRVVNESTGAYIDCQNLGIAAAYFAVSRVLLSQFTFGLQAAGMLLDYPVLAHPRLQARLKNPDWHRDEDDELYWEEEISTLSHISEINANRSR